MIGTVRAPGCGKQGPVKNDGIKGRSCMDVASNLGEAGSVQAVKVCEERCCAQNLKRVNL